MVFDVSKGVVCAFNIQQPVRVGGITMVRAARVSKKTLQPLRVPPLTVHAIPFLSKRCLGGKSSKGTAAHPPSNSQWCVMDQNFNGACSKFMQFSENK